MEASCARFEALNWDKNFRYGIQENDMIETPQIVQTQAQAAAVIRLTVARSEMMKVFGPAVGELMSVLAAQGAEPVGAVFAHHLRMSTDTFDFELGVRVTSPVSYRTRETWRASRSKGCPHHLSWSLRWAPVCLGRVWWVDESEWARAGR
jgi:hypothetical protein